MREIFAPREDDKPDPGRVFYTIRQGDVGKSVINTEIGPVNVREFMGAVMRRDVGKRIYRVPNNAGDWWFWQIENDTQWAQRMKEALG